MRKILLAYGLKDAVEEPSKFKNLTEAALKNKKSLRAILQSLSNVTGEKIKEPRIKNFSGKGITKTLPTRAGLRTGIPKGIKRVILVHSGKGGVGKTFVSVNLALALAKNQHQVGLLDADVDCPNVLKMLGISGILKAGANKKIVPIKQYGIKFVSMAPIIASEDKVLMWRGPVTSKVIEQFIHDTDWGKLDFLIVDMPPGTSDIPISVLTILQGAEVLIVTTPAELALMDAKRALGLAKNHGARILGIIENMSGEIFGIDETAKLAKEQHVNYLGTIELKKKFAQKHEFIDLELEKILLKAVEIK